MNLDAVLAEVIFSVMQATPSVLASNQESEVMWELFLTTSFLYHCPSLERRPIYGFYQMA